MKRFHLSVRIISLLCATVLILLTFSSCSGKYLEKTSFSMGSILTAKIYAEDDAQAEEIFKLINTAVDEADKSLSNTDETAEIFNLNKDKVIFASPFLQNVLSDTILLCNTLNRSIDVSIGKVTSLWGFNTDSPSLPDENNLKTALEDVNIEKIFIDEEISKITIDNSIELDMGAFGKGAACDAAYDEIYNKYIPFIMTLGGTVFAYGEGPSDGKWTVGIRDPFGDANSYFATLKLSPLSPKNAVFVSTSGSYEKTFTQNNKTYHHILDPKTGYPAENDLVSVTVIANSGLNADALSTAFFIKGLTEETKEDIRAFFCEAIFVTKDKTCYVTDGINDIIELTNSEYIVKSIDEK